ncbi:hypothetical protein GCM10009557_51160 [Virgisporangium ochraceum]|uniref:HTH lysR-type domain-containing protein n=1 Tax=Virgisporangium ochraceum TaxID=65505 RepID=A0A8J4EFZ3_9ACTN|nr:LysR family transcriptional regulator [Virgisporangium ochraceum]GIJ73226.1 hypothetical protein Voc01_081430 [Virgisporangium ochraceum]
MDAPRLHVLRMVALSGSLAGAARALHVSAPAAVPRSSRGSPSPTRTP